jgi:hypothetical protein
MKDPEPQQLSATVKSEEFIPFPEITGPTVRSTNSARWQTRTRDNPTTFHELQIIISASYSNYTR